VTELGGRVIPDGSISPSEAVDVSVIAGCCEGVSVLDALPVVDAMFDGIDVEETLTLAATVEFVISLEVVEYSVEGGPECELSDVSTVLVPSRDFDDTRDPVLFSGVGSPAFEDEEVSVTEMGGVIVVPVPSCILNYCCLPVWETELNFRETPSCHQDLYSVVRRLARRATR
jgi:hypothetical protein